VTDRHAPLWMDNSGQTIFGDGKGSTSLVSSGPIIMFQSADHPSCTRDMLIRDIRIDNDVMKATRTPAASASTSRR
jgi:hypothetical protein